MPINIIPELRERGLLQDITPGTEEQLSKELTAAYVGFDPTAESLHIGSLLPIILLMHLQRGGHQPIALVGGATGLIGDPTGKSAERNLLSPEALEKNIQGIKAQLSRFLRFDGPIANRALMVNNNDWMGQCSFIDFIRDVGKHVSVNYMLAKDSVQKRLEFGLSFTEFSYQLIQAYDFYWLQQHSNVKLQAGGADQWGNIVSGLELIRRKGGGEAFAFTCPLLKKADGGKFGKTEQGNVWLDRNLTSPYQFYQYWLNVSDEDAHNLIKVFTFIPLAEISELISVHAEAPHERILQKRLAEELTVMVHSRADYEFAVEASGILFGKDTSAALARLSEQQLLEVLAGVPQVQGQAASILAADTTVLDFIANSQIVSSRAEGRKLIGNGGLSLNKKKISDENMLLTNEILLSNKYILVQKGKKNYYLAVF